MGTGTIHDRASTALAGEGYRYTRARRALVELLARIGEPVTLPDVLAHDPRLSQSSTYRNLGVLEAAGIVHRIVTGDGHAHFELAEDLTEHHHHHLICSECGTVTDFTIPPGIERSLETSLDDTAERHGFTATSHRLDLVGLCETCS